MEIFLNLRWKKDERVHVGIASFTQDGRVGDPCSLENNEFTVDTWAQVDYLLASEVKDGVNCLKAEEPTTMVAEMVDDCLCATYHSVQNGTGAVV